MMAAQIRSHFMHFNTRHLKTSLLRNSIVQTNNQIFLRTISLQGCSKHHNIYAKSPRILEQKNILQYLQCRGINIEDKRKAEEIRNRGLQRGMILATVVLVLCGLGMKKLAKVIEEGKEEDFKSVGDLAIGGPWALTGFDGKPISSADFNGKWYILYFGFTHCPDICPDELDKISTVMTELSKNPKMPKLQTVFVSVDPERDTPKIMQEYCEEFHPDLLGATGTRAEVGTVCRLFRVYYSRGPEDDDGDYVVDHTIIAYLMAPNGATRQYFGQNRKAPDMVKEITTLVVGSQKTFLQQIKHWFGAD